jgi:hypothetical protein
MVVRREDEELIRRYLLGDLAEQEQVKLEERLFSDDDLFKLLQVAEDELMEDYLQGSLSGQENRNFETHFLAAPERRQKLRFATALNRYVSKTAVREPSVSTAPAPEPISFWQSIMAFFSFQNPVLGLSAVAALIIALVGVGLLYRETNRLREQLEQARMERGDTEQQKQLEGRLFEQRARSEKLARQLEQEQNRRTELEQELAKIRPPKTIEEPAGGPNIISFFLLPGLVRDAGEVTRLKIPAGTEQVQLELDLEQDDYKIYSAQIRSDEDAEVWKRDNLKSHKAGTGKAIAIKLPAKLFTAKGYRVILSGATDNGNYEKVGTYYFAVEQKR